MAAILVPILCNLHKLSFFSRGFRRGIWRNSVSFSAKVLLPELKPCCTFMYVTDALQRECISLAHWLQVTVFQNRIK